MGVQSVWCRNLFSRAEARTEETFGEPVPFVPSPPVLRARSQIRPCHLAGHSRKTNPPRFRGRLHFREKPLAFGPRTLRGMNGVGWALTEPHPGQAEGGMHPQPVSSPLLPTGGSSAGLEIFRAGEEQALAGSSHEGSGTLGSVPSSQSKISLHINARGMPQNTSYLLGCGAGPDSLRVFSCPFLSSI